MDNVIVQVTGKDKQIFDGVETVADVKGRLGSEYSKYSVSVNGEPADNDTHLESGDFVTLAPAVKGA